MITSVPLLEGGVDFVVLKAQKGELPTPVSSPCRVSRPTAYGSVPTPCWALLPLPDLQDRPPAFPEAPSGQPSSLVSGRQGLKLWPNALHMAAEVGTEDPRGLLS